MARYHISEDGKARICKADKKPCLLAHGDDPKSAARADEERKEQEGYSQLSSLSKSRVDNQENTVYSENMNTTQNTIERVADTVEQVVKENGSAKKAIVLSDVDGTLVKGSLVLNHAVWLAEKGHRPDIFKDIPQRWLADPKNEEIINELGGAYQAALKGEHIDNIGLNDYLDPVLEDRNNFYSTIDRLHQMKQEGARVVLISGSPDFMIKKMADKFGFEGVGSGYALNDENIFEGTVNTPMFRAETKRAHIVSMALNEDYHITGFGDTSSDLPIFEVSHHSVLVAPNEHTHSKIGHLVNEIVDE